MKWLQQRPKGGRPGGMGCTPVLEWRVVEAAEGNQPLEAQRVADNASVSDWVVLDNAHPLPALYEGEE